MTSDALIEAIAGYTGAAQGGNPYRTAIDGLTLLRRDCPMPMAPLIYKPALCVVAQGAKVGLFGETRVAYRAGQALVVGVEMPGFGHVTEATPDVPFLGAILEFDVGIMTAVLATLDAPARLRPDVRGGVFVADLEASVVDCLSRLVRLLATPRAIPALVPTIVRELSYWLLSGPSGPGITSVVFGTERAEAIVPAMHALRARFADTVRIEELASSSGMSPSAFHRKFKTMTSMTPLQYQKQMRLVEARNYMLVDSASAADAAYRVGYESPSQFSREYARMFGAPPRRDVAVAKAAARLERS